MVNIIKEAFYVTFNKPSRPFECNLNVSQCSVATSVWTETMRGILKVSLVNGFQNHMYHFLHEFILKRGNA